MALPLSSAAAYKAAVRSFKSALESSSCEHCKMQKNDLQPTHQVVKLSRMSMFKELMSTMNLTIFSEDTIQLNTGLFISWAKMDIPKYSTTKRLMVRTLLVQPMCIEAVAKDNLAEAAIKEIVSCAEINVDDLNYSSLCISLQQIDSLHSMVNSLQLENKVLVHQNSRLFHENDAILKKLTFMCASHDDVLPIRIQKVSDVIAGSNSQFLAYTGPNPPLSSADELADYIVNVLLDPNHVQINQYHAMDALD